MKKIVWLSTFDLNTRSGYLSLKFEEFLINNKEKLKSEFVFIDILKNSKNKYQNISKLFSLLDSTEEVSIIYNLENNLQSKLILHLLKLYPGAVFLNDYTLFNLVISRFDHGTTGEEINGYCKRVYQEKSIKIGDQFALKRSISLYSEIFLFLREIECSAPYIYSLLSSDRSLEDNIEFTTKTIKMPVLTTEQKIDNQKDEFRILLLNSKEHGAMAASVCSLVNKYSSALYIRYYKKNNKWKASYSELCLDNCSHDEFLDLNPVDAIVDNLSSFYSGLSPWFFRAGEREIIYFSSDSLESRNLLSHSNNILPTEINIESLPTFLLRQNIYINRIDYQNYFTNVINQVEADFSELSKKLTSFKNEIKNNQKQQIENIVSKKQSDPILADTNYEKHMASFLI